MSNGPQKINLQFIFDLMSDRYPVGDKDLKSPTYYTFDNANIPFIN